MLFMLSWYKIALKIILVEEFQKKFKIFKLLIFLVVKENGTHSLLLTLGMLQKNCKKYSNILNQPMNKVSSP